MQYGNIVSQALDLNQDNDLEASINRLVELEKIVSELAIKREMIRKKLNVLESLLGKELT